METGKGDSKSKMEDYEVIENIGRGAFGAAFLVLHKTENNKYVLKKIHLLKHTEKFRSKACQEMNLIAKLRHPYILEYKDAWVEKGSCLCIVTSYCEVGNISEILRKARRGSYFPEEKLCKWLTQLLLAIDYLHSNRVLHSDLKLSNIFITKENDIRLGDFGLAKLLNEEGIASSVAGTPNYMCPELLADTPYGYKSDIWSLGCCLFEIAARQQAFRAPDMAGLINKINRSLISPLPIVYSSNLKQIIKSMLRKSSEHRPTAAELLRHAHLQPYLLRCQNPSTVFLPVTSPSPNNTKDKIGKLSPCCAGGGAKESKDHKQRETKLKQQRELLPLFEENNYTHYPNLLDDDDVSIEDHLETKRVDSTSYSGKISIDGEDSKSGDTSEIINGDNKGNYITSSLKLENSDVKSKKTIDAEPMCGLHVTHGKTTMLEIVNGDNKGNYVISLKESFRAMYASILPSNAPSEEQQEHFFEQNTKLENADKEREKAMDAEPMCGSLVAEETKLEAEDNNLQTRSKMTTLDTVCCNDAENCRNNGTVKIKETRLVNQEPSDNALLDSRAGVGSDKSNGQRENPRLEKADALESLLELCADLLKQDKFDELNGVLKPFGDDAVSSRETAILLTRSLMNAQKKLLKNPSF